MFFRYIIVCSMISALPVFSGACSQKDISPIINAQACFKLNNDLTAIGDEIKEIGRLAGMEIHDRSLEAAAELKQLGEFAIDPPDWYFKPLLILRIERSDGMGLSISNAGLRNGVALSISQGKDQLEARRFGEMVLSRLRERWNVRELSYGGVGSTNADCAEIGYR